MFLMVVYLVFIANQLLVEGHHKGTDSKGTNGCKFEALRFRFQNDRAGCKDIEVMILNGLTKGRFNDFLDLTRDEIISHSH